MPQTVWLRRGDPIRPRGPQGALQKDGSIRQVKLGAGKGEALPASGIQGFTTGRSEGKRTTVDNTADKWERLEGILRRVIREELDAMWGRTGRRAVSEEISKQAHLFGKKAKIELVNGQWVGITEEQIQAWSAAFGSIDLNSELKRAAAWLISNPDRTPKRYAAFLNNWLSRNQDRSAIRSIPMRNEPGPGKKLCSYCANVATNAPNRIWACDEHLHDAMDQKPIPMVKNGGIAKPVSGS